MRPGGGRNGVLDKREPQKGKFNLSVLKKSAEVQVTRTREFNISPLRRAVKREVKKKVVIGGMIDKSRDGVEESSGRTRKKNEWLNEQNE